MTRAANLSSVRDRLDGYAQTLSEADITLDCSLIAADDASVQGGIRAVHWLLDQPNAPRAVLSLSSVMSLGTVIGLRDRGAQVPEDIALIGFDDASWSEAVTPPMTSLSLCADDVAERAASLLLRWILDQQSPPRVETRIPTRLVIRSSCGCRRSENA